MLECECMVVVGGRGGAAWGSFVWVYVGEFGIEGCVCREIFHNDNYLSVRPPGEQMGFEPANDSRRKSGMCVCV